MYAVYHEFTKKYFTVHKKKVVSRDTLTISIPADLQMKSQTAICRRSHHVHVSK